MARPDGWRVQTRRPVAQANPRGQGRKATVRGVRPPKSMMPYSLEKLLGIESESVPKPTQVGGWQSTKARERNLVKELGKIAP